MLFANGHLSSGWWGLRPQHLHPSDVLLFSSYTKLLFSSISKFLSLSPVPFSCRLFPLSTILGPQTLDGLLFSFSLQLSQIISSLKHSLLFFPSVFFAHSSLNDLLAQIFLLSQSINPSSPSHSTSLHYLLHFCHTKSIFHLSYFIYSISLSFTISKKSKKQNSPGRASAVSGTRAPDSAPPLPVPFSTHSESRNGTFSHSGESSDLVLGPSTDPRRHVPALVLPRSCPLRGPSPRCLPAACMPGTSKLLARPVHCMLPSQSLVD